MARLEIEGKATGAVAALEDVEKKAEEVGSTLRKVNNESKGVTGGVSGMTGAFKSFGTIAKVAVVGASVGLVAVAVAARGLIGLVGNVLTGAFKIATTAIRVMWGVGVAAFRGIASVAQTAVGWVAKVGTVVAGTLVGGLLIGIKRSAELQEIWKAMGGIVPVMYQVKGAWTSLKDTFINGLAVMADSFLASSGLVGGLYQLRDLIIQNGGLFRQVGTWLGEGFVWAKEKVIAAVGYIQENLPTIIATGRMAMDTVINWSTWAFNAVVRAGSLVYEKWGIIQNFIKTGFAYIRKGIDTALSAGYTLYQFIQGMKQDLFGEGSWQEFKTGIIAAGEYVIAWLTEKFDAMISHVATRIKDEIIDTIPGGRLAADTYDIASKGVEAIQPREGMFKRMLPGPLGNLFKAGQALVSVKDSIESGNDPGSEGGLLGAIVKNKFTGAMMNKGDAPTLSSILSAVGGQPELSAEDKRRIQREAMVKQQGRGGGQTLVNQVNYQPGANNIAFYQRLQGLSGGVI